MAEDERLDYCTEWGERLGEASRAAVHARGLWHRTLHLWLATPEDGGSLLYQLRAETTASWPGKLDVTVAGHLLAGEDYRAAMRESEEEIGIAVPPLVPLFLGLRRSESRADGVWNRELQGVHLAVLDPAWGRFSPRDGEAAGLFRIGHDDGLRLHGGACDSLEVDGWLAGPDGPVPCRRRVTRADFVPRDGYYTTLHDLAARLVRGEPATGLVKACGPAL